MRKAIVAFVVVVVLVAAGTFLVGRFVISAESRASTVFSPSPYASTPEWQAFQRASEKGESGWEELQELMTSTDDYVGRQAGLALFRRGEKAAEMYFERLPEVSPAVKAYHRNDVFEQWQYRVAWKTVADPESAAREGAALFLRLPYTRDRLDEATLSGIGDSLVEAIPGADGGFAENLAFTIGLYPPSSLDGLREHLGSGDAQVRLLAVQALGRLEDEAALGEVKRLRRDGAEAVRRAAYDATASIEQAVKLRILAASREAVERADPELARKNAKKRLGMP